MTHTHNEETTMGTGKVSPGSCVHREHLGGSSCGQLIQRRAANMEGGIVGAEREDALQVRWRKRTKTGVPLRSPGTLPKEIKHTQKGV